MFCQVIVDNFISLGYTSSSKKLHMSSFIITTKQFEGPIELLLRLIQDRKMAINEVSLADVADSYIQSIQNKDAIDVSAMTQFLVIAATLMLIKSKSLLPMLDLSDEEEEDIESLEERLKLYRVYVNAGEHIEQQFNAHPTYGRNSVAREIVFAPDEGITVNTLHDSLLSVFNEIPKETQDLPEERVKTVVHIEDVMEDLERRVKQGLQTSFTRMTEGVRTATTITEYRQAKSYAVVSFLAMLEMVKNGIIDVLQDETFTDIAIQKSQS